MSNPREALLEHIAAELDRVMAEERVTQHKLHLISELNPGTVLRLLRAYDARVGTVAQAFHAMGYEVRLHITRVNSLRP